MYSDVSEEGELASEHNERSRYDNRQYRSSDFDRKRRNNHHVSSIVRQVSPPRYQRDRNFKIQSVVSPVNPRAHHSREHERERNQRKHKKVKRSRSRNIRFTDDCPPAKKHHRDLDHHRSKRHEVDHHQSKRKSKRSYSDDSDHSQHQKPKKHKHKSSHKKKKKKLRSRRSRSTSNPLKSSSFIDEILHNESAKNVIKNDESILKDVITTLEKEAFDANNNNFDKSFTPPLTKKTTTVAVEVTPPLPVEKANKNIEHPKTPVDKNKKLSILELPMPPLLKLDVTTCQDPEENPVKLELETKKGCEEDEKVNQIDYCTHKEEMRKQLIKRDEILTPNILPTYRKRATVIGKEKDKMKIDFKNRDMKNFHILEQVGEGTYGKVYKAVDKEDKKMVAMKMIRMENENQGFPITCLREIKNLQYLNHPNIIKLHDVTFDATRNRTYLVFEFMNHDLLGLMSNEEMQFNEKNIFHIIRQVLEGLKFCHDRSIIHRDLKSSNILLQNDGSVKLADFGLSRAWIAQRPYTNKVISLWYRPIELLLGEEQYSPSVDIWSVGCIMTELFKRAPLFPFSDEVDVVDAIYRLCGTPNNNFWPEAEKLPRYKTLSFKFSRPRVVRELFSSFMPPVALDLVDKLLVLNPNKRITAKDALESMWIVNMQKKKLDPLVLPKIDCFEYRVKMNRKRKDG